MMYSDLRHVSTGVQQYVTAGPPYYHLLVTLGLINGHTFNIWICSMRSRIGIPVLLCSLLFQPTEPVDSQHITHQGWLPWLLLHAVACCCCCCCVLCCCCPPPSEWADAAACCKTWCCCCWCCCYMLLLVLLVLLHAAVAAAATHLVSGLMMARTGRPPVILLYQPPPLSIELRDTAWSWPVPVRSAWYSTV
jgi:hypothetical protein